VPSNQSLCGTLYVACQMRCFLDVAGDGRYQNNHLTEMCCDTEAGSYLRLIDSCVIQLEAQGLSRTCNESKEEEEASWLWRETDGRRCEPHAPLTKLRFQKESSESAGRFRG